MSESSRRTNRLAGEASPYLLLHRHNPVDWYPWGEEALARARREDKPIFLSVGYSTCYWCHVMERESFSDPALAERMNREFVNVKVDREERPDLDDLYMTATQLLTGQGGWPNSLFLTPDLLPFFAGTYFPPEDRWGRPGFATVLDSLSRAWRERRPEVEEQAAEIRTALQHHLGETPPAAPRGPGAETAERSLAGLRQRFDGTHGGFGGAPKFPTPANLWLLLELAAERPEAGLMLGATLDAMGRGGLFDQLGGGFHRYATDREWRVPHFEKMLYDNGLLLEAYARDFARSGNAERARVAAATARFLEREMTAPEGALWSAIDAETDGREGAFYAWTRAELEEALAPGDAAFLAPLFGFDGPPFFEADHYVLHLPRPVEQLARERRMSVEALWREVAPLRERLLAERGARRRPATDDKILADWNGTAIAGLAEAGRLLGEPRWIARAAAAADFVLATMRPREGPLVHAWRAGRSGGPAFLADYVWLVHGLLALVRAGGEARFLAAAAALTAEQIDRLRAPEGGFHNAAAAADLLFRGREVFDGALPAANAVAALNLIELAGATGEERFASEAESILRAFAAQVEGHPEGARTMALAARRWAALRPEAIGAAPQGNSEGLGVSSPAPGATGASGHEPGSTAAERLAAEARGVVSPRLELGERLPDGFRRFRLHLAIAAGWHLQANPASAPELVATELFGDGLALRALDYPPGRPWRPTFAGQPLAVYDGEIEISGELRADAPRPRLAACFQACDLARCLPPVEIAVPVD